MAAIGAAVLIGGPGGFDRLGFAPPPAHAAESAPRAAGFADLVAKVKPAVISVKVKIDRSAATDAETSGSGGPNVMPLQPGGPLDKFFQQYGFLLETPKGTRRLAAPGHPGRRLLELLHLRRTAMRSPPTTTWSITPRPSR